MASGIRLIDQLVTLDLVADSAEQALEKIFRWDTTSSFFKATWLDSAIKRESEFPTGLPTLIPVAIPHTDSIHVNADGVGFFKLKNPIEFGEMGSLDEKIQVKMILPLLISTILACCLPFASTKETMRAGATLIYVAKRAAFS